MGISGLDSALSGLRIAQQQLNVISNNVSNVSTPGYSRQILPQQTVTVGGQTVGVRSNAIIRSVDLNLERDLWTQVSTVSFNDVKISYLNRIQQFHGPPDLEVSIAAEIAELRDSFAGLADSPEDGFQLNATVNQAVTVAKKLNDLGGLITQMRNDAQDEITGSVAKINQKLQEIAEANKQIKLAKINGKTTAAVEDLRDQAIKDLSEEMKITFFTRGDGVLVVQTAQGVQLADERAETLFFQKSVIGPTSAYPDSANGIYVGGNPATNPNAIDITASGLNGKLGAYVELRDEIMPRQMAMADELAHKLALRFAGQGLHLFTDASGSIPADTPPDPNTNPPTPVAYLGFSSEIRVNSAILNDNTLLRSGTVPTDLPVQTGSNEVIRRVIQFVFGDVSYQQASGTTDLRASGSGTSLQEWLGVFSDNQVTGTTNVGNHSSLAALVSAGGNALAPPNDQFTLTFEESRTTPPLGPISVTVSLDDANTNFPIGGAINDAADQLVAEINSQITAAGVPPGLAAQASRNGYGQIVLQSHGDMIIDTAFAGGMSEEGLGFIGLKTGTFKTTDPFIEVVVGNDPPVKVTIEPGDDETDLVAKLEKINAADPGIPGLAVDLDAGTGRLTIRPGDDSTNPSFGGDIRIIGGPFEADGTGTIPGGVTTGTGIVAALFGSSSPVTDFHYSSQTSNGSSVAFRSRELGPGANISTGVISSLNLIDFAQKMVNRQTEEINSTEASNQDETAFRDLLQRRLSDESGVNIDEELSNLIIVQTAYAAAAKVVSAIDEQFRELLRAF